MHAATAALPNGGWSWADMRDDHGTGRNEAGIALPPRKTGRTADCGFTGSTPQVTGPANHTLNGVRLPAGCARRAPRDPSMSKAEGVMPAFEINAPEGPIANRRASAPSRGAPRAEKAQPISLLAIIQGHRPT